VNGEQPQRTPADEAVRLVLGGRWAALATTGDRGPLGSMVSYAVEPRFGGVLMFLSRLSLHIRNLETSPEASLVVSLPDGPAVVDPQTIPRVSLQGPVATIDRSDPGFAAAWRIYTVRLPTAQARLGLGDFTLYRLLPEEARFVGGFGAARTLRGDALREAARRLEG
jgi:putative heme iron utilization protein